MRTHLSKFSKRHWRSVRFLECKSYSSVLKGQVQVLALSLTVQTSPSFLWALVSSLKNGRTTYTCVLGGRIYQSMRPRALKVLCKWWKALYTVTTLVLLFLPWPWRADYWAGTNLWALPCNFPGRLVFIYFKETLEVSKYCRKANGIWICWGEEGGLQREQLGRKPSIQLGSRASRVPRGSRWMPARESWPGKAAWVKKNHILPNKLGHIRDGVSHWAELGKRFQGKKSMIGGPWWLRSRGKGHLGPLAWWGP